jgi:hypothetical protein
MKSLLLMSVLIGGLVIPGIAARDRNPRRGARRMLVLLLAFNLLYVAYLTLVHTAVYVPKW